MNSITKLASALVKAQAKMDGALKDSANPFFKSKYADLSSVVSAIKPVAAEFGLGYIQVSHNVDNHAAIETVIVHESGESFSCGIVAVPVAKVNAQDFGSAMTYARRYSLSAAFGVCPEDDDGNAAAKAPPKGVASISPNDVGKDFWNNAEGDEKAYLNAELGVIRDYLAADDAINAAKRFYHTMTDMEEQAAVWSQLSSKERKAIKDNKQQPMKEAA